MSNKPVSLQQDGVSTFVTAACFGKGPTSASINLKPLRLNLSTITLGTSQCVINEINHAKFSGNQSIEGPVRLMGEI